MFNSLCAATAKVFKAFTSTNTLCTNVIQNCGTKCSKSDSACKREDITLLFLLHLLFGWFGEHWAVQYSAWNSQEERKKHSGHIGHIIQLRNVVLDEHRRACMLHCKPTANPISLYSQHWWFLKGSILNSWIALTKSNQAAGSHKFIWGGGWGGVVFRVYYSSQKANGSLRPDLAATDRENK